MVGVAAVEVIVGSIGLLTAVVSPTSVLQVSSPWSQLVSLAAFAAAGGMLLLGARSDERATYLGVAFVLVAGAFAHPGLDGVSSDGPDFLRIVAASLRAVRIDALVPLFLWLFVCRFPRALATPRSARIGTAGVWLSAAAGAGVLCAGVVRHLKLLHDPQAPWLEALSIDGTHGVGWAVVYSLACAALPVMVLRARHARPDEKRRVALFVAALVCGSLPAGVIVVVATLVPAIHDVFRGPTAVVWAVPAARMLLATVPLCTAYVVLVERVLAVRVLLRRALRYSLARSTIAVVSAIPILWLLGFLYQARNDRLADLVTGGRALGLLGIVVVVLATLRLRGVALAMLDRLFFRDQYEAHRILTALAGRSRSNPAGSARETADSFAAEIDRALHVDRVDVLTLDPLRGELRSSKQLAPSLGSETELASRIARFGKPTHVDLQRGGEVVDGLPEPDRHWLAAAGFQVLVPLLGSSGELVGCIGLGMKRSEAEWSGEDLELLEAVGASAGLALENRLLLDSGRDARTSGGRAVANAKECSSCQRVVPAAAETCPSCGTALVSSVLPPVLFGKFRLETRIGSGATGLVFRATDLDLGRPVAIKTLPRVSPEHAFRLRREARALAALSHPNLATIYSAETWNDIPLLVLEYLSGGSLEARIRQRRLAQREVVALGLAMMEVLERLHFTGVLHRDIKPSNVGFTDDGVPKLLDFDLVRILAEAGAVPPADEVASDDDGVPNGGMSMTSYGGLAGTPSYMSPEALLGEAPDVSFDLWGASVTLYEAVAGVHPFSAASWKTTATRILQGRCPDVRESAPECSEDFAVLLRDALARDRRRRPSSARDMRRRLRELAA